MYVSASEATVVDLCTVYGVEMNEKWVYTQNTQVFKLSRVWYIAPEAAFLVCLAMAVVIAAIL